MMAPAAMPMAMRNADRARDMRTLDHTGDPANHGAGPAGDFTACDGADAQTAQPLSGGGTGAQTESGQPDSDECEF